MQPGSDLQQDSDKHNHEEDEIELTSGIRVAEIGMENLQEKGAKVTENRRNQNINEMWFILPISDFTELYSRESEWKYAQKSHQETIAINSVCFAK